MTLVLTHKTALHEEYEQFLAQLYKSYLWLKKEHPELFATVSGILKDLAIGNHVTPPDELLWNPEYCVKAFASSQEVTKSMIRFYRQFKVTYWKHDDQLAVEKLTALVTQDRMKF